MTDQEVSPDMRNRIVRAIYQTWTAIAPDILQATGGVSQREAVELAMEHLDVHGGDHLAVQALRGLPEKTQRSIARVALPHKSYGW